MKCDAARVEEIWRRIEDEFCERLTPEDYARFANHLKQYPPPESPG